MKLRPAALFSLLVLIFFCVFLYEAKDWRMQARLYPWAIGIPMLVLALVQVILDLKGYTPKETVDATPLDFQFSKAIEPAVARKRAITMFAWLLGFFLLVWLLGFEYGIPLMVFGYLKLQSNESWVLSITLTVLAFVFFWILFVKLLTLPFPQGLIFTWLGMG